MLFFCSLYSVCSQLFFRQPLPFFISDNLVQEQSDVKQKMKITYICRYSSHSTQSLRLKIGKSFKFRQDVGVDFQSNMYYVRTLFRNFT